MKTYKLKTSAIDVLRTLVKEDRLETVIKEIEELASSDNGMHDTNRVRCVFDGGPKSRGVREFEVSFYADDFDAVDVKDYDPNGWNHYPTVKPPKGKLFFVWVTPRPPRPVPMAGKTFKDNDTLFVWEEGRWVQADALDAITINYREVVLGH